MPFPGAHSQVAGRGSTSSGVSAGLSVEPTQLPLEAAAAPLERGWIVRLRVRAESIEVQKQAVVYERVVVRRREVASVARVATRTSREELRVDLEGAASVSTPQT
jgi:uncharacterized protein (TIGR02271 family)